MLRAEIRIELKKGVADPEGKNVKKTLELLGFGGIRAVKTVKVFIIEMETDDREKAARDAEEMCQKLLANPVIQNYSISIEG